MVQVRRSELRDLLGQSGVGRVRDIHEARVVGELLGLVGHHLRDFFPAVADIHAPQARDPIEVSAALGIKDIGTLPPCHDERTFLLERGKRSVGVNRMIAILLPDRLGIVR